MPKYNVLVVFKYSPDLAGRFKARREALRLNSREEIEEEEHAIRTMQERTMRDLKRVVHLAFDDVRKRNPQRTFLDYEFLRSSKAIIPIYSPKEWKLRIVVFKNLEAFGFKEARTSAVLISRPKRGEVWVTWAYASYEDVEVEISD